MKKLHKLKMEHLTRLNKLAKYSTSISEKNLALQANPLLNLTLKR